MFDYCNFKECIQSKTTPNIDAVSCMCIASATVCGRPCFSKYSPREPFVSSVCPRLSSVMQGAVWALLFWPCLLTVSFPIDCKEQQGSFSNCPSISQEKLLDRVIQHAELIYRVSEESCALFVSNTNHHTQSNLCILWLVCEFSVNLVKAMQNLLYQREQMLDVVRVE